MLLLGVLGYSLSKELRLRLLPNEEVWVLATVFVHPFQHLSVYEHLELQKVRRYL